MILALLVSLASPGGGLANCADLLAADLAAGLARRDAAQAPLLLGELRGAAGDPAAAGLEAALTRALGAAGLRLTDRAALAHAASEGTLAGSDKDLAELAGAAGAKVIVTGSVEKSGEERLVSLRAVHVVSGEVLASASATLAAGVAESPLEARSLQAELRRLGDRLARGLDALPGEARYQSFAVLPFEESGAAAKDAQLGLLVSAELTTLLSRDHDLMLVERAQLARIVDELALGQSGLLDPERSAEVGKLAGAQALVVGSVAAAGDRYLVNARIIGVADGQVALATQAELPAADLVALSSEAVVLRSRAGAVYRSLLLPGWGQLYNRQGEKGALFAIAEASMGGVALAFHLRGNAEITTYRAMTQGDFAAQRAEASTAYARRDLALWVLLGVHALNVVDALWSGRTFDSATPARGGM